MEANEGLVCSTPFWTQEFITGGDLRDKLPPSYLPTQASSFSTPHELGRMTRNQDISLNNPTLTISPIAELIPMIMLLHSFRNQNRPILINYKRIPQLITVIHLRDPIQFLFPRFLLAHLGHGCCAEIVSAHFSFKPVNQSNVHILPMLV